INGIQSAVVHLALPKSTDFMKKTMTPKASLVLHLAPGVSLSTEQIQGITFLVASSIPYMKPADVTVLDQTGQLLTGEDASPFALSNTQIKYRDEVEEKLKNQILNVLVPIIG